MSPVERGDHFVVRVDDRFTKEVKRSTVNNDMLQTFIMIFLIFYIIKRCVHLASSVILRKAENSHSAKSIFFAYLVPRREVRAVGRPVIYTSRDAGNAARLGRVRSGRVTIEVVYHRYGRDK
jgi:hypothetical protein